MFISTIGKSREEVLTALIARVLVQKELLPTNLRNVALFATQIVRDRGRSTAPNYVLGDIEIPLNLINPSLKGMQHVTLNVDLSNPDGFEDKKYNGIHGDGAASDALEGFKYILPIIAAPSLLAAPGMPRYYVKPVIAAAPFIGSPRPPAVTYYKKPTSDPDPEAKKLIDLIMPSEGGDSTATSKPMPIPTNRKNSSPFSVMSSTSSTQLDENEDVVPNPRSSVEEIFPMDDLIDARPNNNKLRS